MIDRRFLTVSLAVQGVANEPAANPTEGTQYIVGSSGTGAFSGISANTIARYDGSAWKFSAPKAGSLEVLNISTGEILGFNGSAWSVVASFGVENNIKFVKGIVRSGSSNNPSQLINEDIGILYISSDPEEKGLNGLIGYGFCAISSNEGDAYLSLDDGKLYTYHNNEFISTDNEDGDLFFVEVNQSLYRYQSETHSFTKIIASSRIIYVNYIADNQLQEGSEKFNSLNSGKTFLGLDNTSVFLGLKNSQSSVDVFQAVNEGTINVGDAYACKENGKIYTVCTEDSSYFFSSYSLSDGEIILNAHDNSLYSYRADNHSFTKINIESSDLGYEPLAPVLAIVPTGNNLPASASAGDAFLNTSDAKLYTATAANTWDAGTATTNGSRYASSTDFKIYESDGTALTSTDILNGDLFLNKEEGSVYVYDASASAFVKVSGSSASQDWSTEIHTLTASEVSAKSFTLTNSIATGQENGVTLSVCGIIQTPSVDFTASGNTISWTNKGLANIDLAAGDVFIVHYLNA